MCGIEWDFTAQRKVAAWEGRVVTQHPHLSSIWLHVTSSCLRTWEDVSVAHFRKRINIIRGVEEIPYLFTAPTSPSKDESFTVQAAVRHLCPPQRATSIELLHQQR